MVKIEHEIADYLVENLLDAPMSGKRLPVGRSETVKTIEDGSLLAKVFPVGGE